MKQTKPGKSNFWVNGKIKSENGLILESHVISYERDIISSQTGRHAANSQFCN
jgi:hypothetical protein